MMKKGWLYVIDVLSPILIGLAFIEFDFKMHAMYGTPYHVSTSLVPPIITLIVHIVLCCLLFWAFSYVHTNMSGYLIRFINGLMLVMTITITVLSQAVPVVINFFEMTGLLLPVFSGYFAALTFLPSKKD